MSSVVHTVPVDGPWYEDLAVGQRFDAAPGLTLTGGHAALHQAIVGDRLPLALDGALCERVVGPGGCIAHPGLVCDVAIGQSTLATQRVIANLFYRGLVLRRAPRIGETLRTTTQIVALRDVSPRPGRQPRGLAVLHVRTVDETDREVLDFHRCAMLPMRESATAPGHSDDLDAIRGELTPELLRASVAGWDLAAYRELAPGAHADALVPGVRYEVEAGDSVTSAPELARLSLNAAAAHVDPAAGGHRRRLVYGGHTIGIALAQVTRIAPNVVTVVAWRSCDHRAPVFEGDVLRSIVTVAGVQPLGEQEGALVELYVETRADRVDGTGCELVLEWRPVVVMA